MTEPRPLVSIVIPVYNEERTILELLERVKRVELDKEIVVVEDASTDRTRELLQAHPDPLVRVFFSEKNGGRGKAVRRGWQEARGEIVVHQDADLEYDPAEIPAVVRPIVDGEADVVFGSRFLGRIEGMMARARLGNLALAWVTSFLYGACLTDPMTCYKAARTAVLLRLGCREDGFELEPELTAKALRGGLRVREVPIGFAARGYAEGKKMRARHFFTVLWSLLRYRFRDGAGRA